MININPSDKYYSIQEVGANDTPYKIFGNKMFRYLIYNKWLITIHMDEEPWNFSSPVKIVYDERYRSENENIKKIFELYPDIKNELDNIKNKINIDIICNDVILNLAIEFKNIFEKNNYNVIINCTDNLSEYKLKDDGFIFMITPQHYYNRKNMTYLENVTRNGKCIFYFMEQVSARINDTKYSEQYMDLTKVLIESSIISFDYNKDNLQYFDNIHYSPPPIITNNVKSGKIYDILFIGIVNDDTRRKYILDSLKRFFKIKIVYDKTGQELTKIINQSKVVLNLHYYNENTLLEEVRLNEIINSDTHILSELPHIDVDAMKEKYKDRVTFINIIEKPNKIIKKTDPIVVELKKLLKKPNKKYEHNFNNDLTEKILIENIRGSIEEYKKYNEYPHLFHKYLLKIKNPNTEITYNIEKENKYKNFYVKNFAHLHCYDISKFHEIYDEYLEKIDKYFNIIITYSIGEIKDIDYTIIKIPNKGMDIGAKFCMIKYLNDKNLEYDYVMFLHSKSDPKQRKKYFQIVDDLNDKFIKNIHDYDSYFPDIKWEIIDGRLKMLSGNPEYENSNLPERNLLYRNELLKYLNCDNDKNIFTEGNVYILKNTVINKLFTDKYLYNILNEPEDFDYNWITYRYGIKGDIKQVYDEFKLKKLKPRDEKSYDGYIEHVFERVVLNCCSNSKNNNIDNNNYQYYFICTSINSGDYCVAHSLSQNISNSKVITTYEVNFYNFKKENIIIFLDNTQMQILDINKLNCIKVAWVRNWERKWLKYLKIFDYVLCCTNKAKEYIESKGIKSYILPIGSNFNNYNFNQNFEYDILIDCNLFNRRKIVNNVIQLVKLKKYKILIIGKGWDKYLSKEEFNLIKMFYKEFTNYDQIKNYYLQSKIIIDDCNINTVEFGSVNKRVIDTITCKRIIITNNKVGNNEIFNNILPYYDSFTTLKNIIDYYINDNNLYRNKINELYSYSVKFLNNDKFKHVFTNLSLFQKNNTNIDLVIKICGRGKVNFTFTDSYQWGDLFMAGNIRNELYNLYGLNCQICLINDWYNYKMYNCKNILFLRGISIYNPKPENNNMVLFISHPESYTDKEFKEYNKIICCSKIFYEKIKTNLKLSEDEIIFALQPLHSSIPDKIDKVKKLEYEAVFIGNKIRERTCISGLSQTNLKKVKIYGDYWNSISTPPALDNIKPINSSKVNNIYKLSQIVLNDTWEDMRINGFVSDRILTALLFSNNVITDDVYGINDFKFENIYIFKDSNELNHLFEKLLKTPKNICNSKNKHIILNNNNKLYDFIYTSLNFKIKNSETKDFYYNFTLSQINIFNKRLDQIKKEYKKNEKINIPEFKFDDSPLIKNAKVFTMVKNELDIIPYYLKHYSTIFGIENLHIIDNDSTDGTYEYLQNIKKLYHKFHLMRTPKKFTFINKKDFINEQVNKYKNYSKYIFILDADEFLFSLDNNIKKQFEILNSKKSDDLVVRLPDYLCYNYKNNFFENTQFIDDDELCFRKNYSKCMFTNKSFRNLTDNGNHNFNINEYLITDLRILHFHTRGKKKTISKKLNLLSSYYGNFDVEKLNKLVIGFNARHVAEDLLDYIINTNNFKYSSDLNIININVLTSLGF